MAGPKIGPDAWEAVKKMLTLESLAIMAGILTAWVVGHAFGISEVVDILITLVGIFSIGIGIFAGIDELYEYAKLVYSPSGDLNRAADHLAQAFAILGFQAVLAFFFKFRPRGAVNQLRPGQTFNVGPKPPGYGGMLYKPKTLLSGNLPAGVGETTAWGDVVVSLRGSAADLLLALKHERIHQILTPKLNILRDTRVTWKMGSYIGSSLLRYLEEALAEVRAQVGVNGWRNTWVGIKFPVTEGYCFLLRAGANNHNFGGFGVIREFGVLIGIITDGELSYEVVVATAHQVKEAESKMAAKAVMGESDGGSGGR
ncbi:MAG: hypothetical protein FWD68_22105 [Alphaproteobacteria bacterium]|nr:hypothetical protein [Alphaproteobacteria bacterium]